MSGDDFPYHRCVDYHVESLPYRLSLPVEEGDDMFCMNFSYVGPPPTRLSATPSLRKWPPPFPLVSVSLGALCHDDDRCASLRVVGHGYVT